MTINSGTPMTLKESVRKRPAMYFGNDGVIGLLAGLLTDLIATCKSNEITFEITIPGENDFILGIKTNQTTDKLYESFLIDKEDLTHYYSTVLKILSSRFEIKRITPAKFELFFSFDKEAIPDPVIDYFKLSEKMLQIALLNRHIEIITLDKRTKSFNQNYYHFPQGIFYLFDRAIVEALGKPVFKLVIDERIKNHAYQIGLAYRTDWFPTPNITSFANDVHTICGGSLVDGILDGLLNACKMYAKENNLGSFKINRKKFTNGLILVCAVRGHEFKYGGSFKEILEENTIRSEVKKLISNAALHFFRTEQPCKVFC